MVWVQNLIVVIIGFLLYRFVIEEDLHLVFVDSLLGKAEAYTSELVSAVLLLSYALSLLFPNTVVVIAMIPMIITIIERIDDLKLRKSLTTILALALVYGANIGGMGSMIGASSNIILLGYIEVLKVPGRENVTFFSWLLLGVPITLILLLFGKAILTFKMKKQPLKCIPKSPIHIEKKRLRLLVLFLAGNIILIILLTAAEFFFHPAPVWKVFNVIDLSLFFYLVIFFFFALIFPKNGRPPQAMEVPEVPSPAGMKKKFVFSGYILSGLRQNLFYFFFFLLLSPLIMAGELWADINKRFHLKKRNPAKDFSRRLFARSRQFFLGARAPDIAEKNSRGFLSINRLIYDIPYLGLMFMGIVVLVVFSLLKLGDNPNTPGIDGWIFQLLGNLTASILKINDSFLVLLFVLIFLTVFSTEMINNVTVILVMFSLISTIAPQLGVNPLFLMVAVTIGSTAAFMTPIASPVNAVSYAGLPGVSLKRMLITGFFMNLACTLWLGAIFYTLYIFFS
jgi:sodium-dependent dicarboxylate transporter 2/3/5